MLFVPPLGGRMEIKMEIHDILSKVDHTLLATDATWEQIREVCDDGISFGTASVCIPPSFVKSAKGYVEDGLKICTVIGSRTATVPRKQNASKRRMPLKTALTR